MHSWGVGIGLLAMWACLAFFLLPGKFGGNPVVEHQLGGWDDLYYATYGVAGACMLFGLLGRRRCEALEAFGLCLFIAGLCVNLSALIATLGPMRVIDGMGTWLSYVIGAAGRLLIVARFEIGRASCRERV